jgi:predicted TIM-barrel fold metal-dependent hydrolase
VIVDCHTHVPSEAVAPRDRKLAISGSQRRHGIDHSLLFTLDGLFGDADRHNQILAAYVAKDPARLSGFATVNPREARAADDLRVAIRGYGLRGLKLHPWLQGFHPLDPSMQVIGETAAELGIPILFHDGTPPYSTPLQVAAFAARHPDVQVILGHAGLLDLWSEALAASQRHPNVWLCFCGPPTYALQEMVDRGPRERMLFGSDIGFGGGSGYGGSPNDDIVRHRLSQVRTLGLPPDDLEALLGGNATRLLGL